MLFESDSEKSLTNILNSDSEDYKKKVEEVFKCTKSIFNTDKLIKKLHNLDSKKNFKSIFECEENDDIFNYYTRADTEKYKSEIIFWITDAFVGTELISKHKNVVISDKSIVLTGITNFNDKIFLFSETINPVGIYRTTMELGKIIMFMKSKNISYKKAEKILMEEFTKYTNDKVECIKIKFSGIKDIKNFEREIKNVPNFYVCFDKAYNSIVKSWIRDNEIEFDKCYTINTYNNEHIKIVDNCIILESFNLYDLKISDKQYKQNFKTICYDIEAFSEEILSGQFITPDNDTSTIFAISLCLTTGPVIDKVVIITYHDVPYDHRYLLIKTESEKELLLKYIEVISIWNPGFILDFNGWSFDCNFIRTRMRNFSIGNYIYKLSPFRFSKYSLKCSVMEKDNMVIRQDLIIDKVYYYYIPGITHFDVRLECMKKQFKNKSKSSLAYYLKTKNLGTKFDVSAYKMSIAHINKNAEILYETMVYCCNDSAKTFQILERDKLLLFNLVISSTCKILPKESILFGVTHKVESLIKYYTLKLNYSYCPDIFPHYDKSIKINGGYVKDPLRGIYRNMPIAVYDFNSLYPSIIVTFNISQNSIVVGDNEIEKLDKSLNIVKMSLNETNYCFVNDGKGIYGAISKILLSLRTSIKKEIEELCKDPEWSTDADKSSVIESLNQKQNTVKIVSNSLFGVLSTKLSRFFNPYIASAITGMGQHIIKNTISLITNKGFEVIYGDTDSLFVMLYKNQVKNINLYKKINKLGELIKDYINNTNIKLYNSINNYITIKYEKLLYYFMLSKKKTYVYRETEPGGIIIKNSELKTSGSDAVKSDKSIISESFFMFMINKILDENNINKNFDEICNNSLMEFCTGMDNKYVLSDYIKSVPYKKDKKNIMVQKYVERVKENIIFGNDTEPLPKPGERIEYVIGRPGYKGRVCDKMLAVTDKTTLDHIDKIYYIKQILQHSKTVLYLVLLDKPTILDEMEYGKLTERFVRKYLILANQYWKGIK